MNTPLFTFQEDAIDRLLRRIKIVRDNDDTPRCISFTAPTGAGKTVMMTGFIENVFCGTDTFDPDPKAIFVWLSDSPELNKQTFDKMLMMSDRINPVQLVTIEPTFDAEELAGGTVYFLNTQKLGKDNKLVSVGDGRQYTIWQTLTNTAANHGEHLYVIIDEAHRGALSGKNNGLPIMQRFIKGSLEDGMVSMPLVIGVTATPKRFDALVLGANCGVDKIEVPIQDVKESGLLKERIILHKQESEIRADEALFGSAVDEWIKVTETWHKYCEDEDENSFNPLLVVQVENETSGSVTGTDLSMCYRVLEEKLGRKLTPGEAVHAFPGKGELQVAGGAIQEIEPSAIQNDANAIVVFFKENLSTGWDCPRAETLVSFRTALDETYIAQILGRMIRTPLRRSIESVSSLNDVSLFVPYFDEENTKKLLKALEGELQIQTTNPKEIVDCGRDPAFADVFALLATKTTFVIDKAKKKTYLRLVMDLAACLTMDGIAQGLRDEVLRLVVDKMVAELARMKSDGTYADARSAVESVVTKTIVINNPVGGAAAVTGQGASGYVSGYDVDVAFEDANRKLGSGLGLAYLIRRSAEDHKEVKIDLIVLSKDMRTMEHLESFAESMFNQKYSAYQSQIAALDESKRMRYTRMIRSAAKPVPLLMDKMPERIDSVRNSSTLEYDKHLYCDGNRKFPAKLTSWEVATLKKEMGRSDFYAWLRNFDRKPWSFVVPYEMDGVALPMYPDFIIARKVDGNIVLDALEPHRSDTTDNWPKAVGMAKYAKDNPGALGRMLMIREMNVAGTTVLKALDMAKLSVRNKVLPITTDSQLKALFESDGVLL